jgi:hypothetical protein
MKEKRNAWGHQLARLSMDRQIQLRRQHRPCGHAQCGNPAEFAASYKRIGGNGTTRGVVLRHERLKCEGHAQEFAQRHNIPWPVEVKKPCPGWATGANADT